MVAVREAATGRVRSARRPRPWPKSSGKSFEACVPRWCGCQSTRTLAPGERPPEPRTEGEAMIIPTFEEMVVVETRLVLKEEL